MVLIAAAQVILYSPRTIGFQVLDPARVARDFPEAHYVGHQGHTLIIATQNHLFRTTLDSHHKSLIKTPELSSNVAYITASGHATRFAAVSDEGIQLFKLDNTKIDTALTRGMPRKVCGLLEDGYQMDASLNGDGDLLAVSASWKPSERGSAMDPVRATWIIDIAKRKSVVRLPDTDLVAWSGNTLLVHPNGQSTDRIANFGRITVIVAKDAVGLNLRNVLRLKQNAADPTLTLVEQPIKRGRSKAIATGVWDRAARAEIIGN